MYCFISTVTTSLYKQEAENVSKKQQGNVGAS